MKKFLVFFCLLFPALLSAQNLKQFDLQEMSEQAFLVFTDHPDEAALIIHTAIPGLTFRSSTDGIVKTRQDISKWILFIRPENQVITIQAPGFMEERFSSGLTEAKATKTFRLNSKETNYSPDKGSMVINSQPSRALMTIDGIPDFSQFTPYEMKDYEAKPYRIRLQAQNYLPLDTTIVIVQGIKQSKLFTLQTTVGFLTLSSARPVKGTLNGNPVEITTEEVIHTLKPGLQQLSIQEAGYEPISENINLEAGEYLQKAITLVKLEGRLIFDFPEIVDVKVGEISFKKPAGIQTRAVPPGSYVVTVTRDGYDPWQQTVTLKHKEQVRIIPDFSARESRLTVTVIPAGARVQLTGNGVNRALGFAPVTTDLMPGDYELELSADGFETQRKSISAKNGKEISLSVSLNSLPGMASVASATQPPAQVVTPPPQHPPGFHLLYAGWGNMMVFSDSFTDQEQDGTIEKGSFGLVLGYRLRLGGETSAWFADFRFHGFQGVKTSYGEPVDQLYLTGLSGSLVMTPFQWSIVDPYLTAGYRQVMLGESPLGLPSGEYLLSHQVVFGAGIEIVPIRTAFEINRSIITGNDLPVLQLMIRGGIGL